MALSGGLDITCADEGRRGGVKKLWIIERDDVTSFTEGSSHDYSGVTLGSGKIFRLFEFEDFTASATGESSAENGSKIINRTLKVLDKI